LLPRADLDIAIATDLDQTRRVTLTARTPIGSALLAGIPPVPSP
jgi:hypothetical protein